MRVRLARFFLAVWVPLMAGCFEAPIAPPQGKELEPALLGNWRCQTPDSEEPEEAEVSLTGPVEGQYKVLWTEQAGTTEEYRAYPVIVSGIELLSVEEATSTPGKLSTDRWAVVRLVRAPENELLVEMPVARLLRLPDEQALAELRARPADDALWELFARCRRPNAEPRSGRITMK
jgi:hypothetical protein